MSWDARPAFLACLVTGACALAACDAPAPGDTVVAGDLRMTGAWARPAAAGTTSAAYLTIANEGGEDDALLGVTCEIAAVCAMHQTSTEGDIIHMEPLTRLEVPAGSEVALEPGGVHIMLVDPRTDLAPGDLVPLVLRFEVGGEVRIEAEVIAP